MISHALYPEVHRDFRQFIGKYSDTSILPTPFFFSKMKVGEEFVLTHQNNRDVTIKLVAIGNTSDEGFKRVFFEVNNNQNSFDVLDRTSESSFQIKRDKADAKEKGQVGCAMKGLIVDIIKNDGDLVDEGEPLAVLSAMKMETIISAPISGRILKYVVSIGDALD